MAGKSNTSATFFAQKKLLGKAHTSNLKTDGEELIGSNIQAASSLIFGEDIPVSPSLDLYTIQSASADAPGTVEYIPFILTALTGTTYDANSTNPDGGSGQDSSESSQVAGPHAYKFVLPSDYVSNTNNSRAGNGIFNNNKIVHETLGQLQLVPPFFSQDAPNPYIIKIYKDNGSGGLGDQIPLLDNIDWNVDYYNGILFLQDYKADKIPAHARAFAYVGKMAKEVIASGSGGSGGGSLSATDEVVLTTTSSNIPGGKLLVAGSGVEIQKTSNTVIISAPAFESSRKKLTFFMTSSIPSGTPVRVISSSFDEVENDSKRIDIVYNGQFLHTGSFAQVSNSERDYFISGSDHLVFSFPVFPDDIIDTIVNKQQYTTSLSKEMVFNEVLSGTVDGSNTQFSLKNMPFHSSSVSVFVNGLLQTPHHLGLNIYDYSVTGSNILFNSSSIPEENSILLSIYEKVV